MNGEGNKGSLVNLLQQKKIFIIKIGKKKIFYNEHRQFD